MEYIKIPQRIEDKSFEIITEEAGTSLNHFSLHEQAIVKRVIHTTADFEYADLMEFHPDALEVAFKSIREGQGIYVDTTMIATGIRRKEKDYYGLECINYVHDPDVYEIAQKEGITRSMASIKKAMKGESMKVFAIGNAPTAIFQLREIMAQEGIRPDLIIGVPVGFVGADESKALLSSMGVPFIRVNGRKGGSTVAVAIINAILKIIYEADHL